ncbi:MAG TPA: energy-coupling factor transporter ATPase [Desulfobacteria bacterium]|nr:energy-coupling factor transporter ATPase [Desulfobacteria bacterium]
MSIEFQDVSFIYSYGTPFARQSLKDINLTINKGEWLVVMGPTGSGKSTLLQHLNGLLKPTEGRVLLDGADINSSMPNIKAARGKVGLVFQYPEHQLFGSTVFEEVAYGPQNFGFPKDEIPKTVEAAMNTVGLNYAGFKDRSPHELSGGEKRRVALAAILAARPGVIALDEPTAGLDSAGKKVLVETITRLNRESRITVIWVTHEITEIAQLADSLLVLEQGQARLSGLLRETLANPLLEELGLDLPVALQIANGLKRQGKSISGCPVTIDEIEQEILRLVR